MTTPESGSRGRIVRVLTYGKGPDAIDQAIIDAIEGGRRVLVKVASASETYAEDVAEASAIAAWAEEMSRRHGLGWERVGGDVLFSRSLSPAAPG